MKKNARYRSLFILILTLVVYSCGVSKFIPEDEVLYAGSEIQIETEEDTVKINQVAEELNT